MFQAPALHVASCLSGPATVIYSAVLHNFSFKRCFFFSSSFFSRLLALFRWTPFFFFFASLCVCVCVCVCQEENRGSVYVIKILPCFFCFFFSVSLQKCLEQELGVMSAPASSFQCRVRCMFAFHAGCLASVQNARLARHGPHTRPVQDQRIYSAQTVRFHLPQRCTRSMPFTPACTVLHLFGFFFFLYMMSAQVPPCPVFVSCPLSLKSLYQSFAFTEFKTEPRSELNISW